MPVSPRGTSTGVLPIIILNVLLVSFPRSSRSVGQYRPSSPLGHRSVSFTWLQVSLPGRILPPLSGYFRLTRVDACWPRLLFSEVCYSSVYHHAYPRLCTMTTPIQPSCSPVTTTKTAPSTLVMLASSRRSRYVAAAAHLPSPWSTLPDPLQHDWAVSLSLLRIHSLLHPGPASEF